MEHRNIILTLRILSVTMLLMLGSTQSFGQVYTKAKWSLIKMDSTFDSTQGKATKVIDGHNATSPMLLKPVGKCNEEIKYHQLSDFVTGLMLDYTTQRLIRATKNPQAKADLAIVKFRNSNSCIPAGDVTPLDIISLFPIDNQLVILDLKGNNVRKLIRNSVKDGAVSSLTEDQIEDNRLYKVTTIDCLLKGNAGSDIMERAEKLDNCNTPLCNMLIMHLRKLSQKGEIIINK